MVTGFLIFLYYSCSSLEKNIQNPLWWLFRKRLLVSYTLMILFKIECLKIPLETPSGICLEKIACVFGKQLINPLLLLWNSGKECLHAPFKVCWEKGVCEPYLTFIWKKKCLYYISGVSLENSGYGICLEKNAYKTSPWYFFGKESLPSPLRICLEKSACVPPVLYGAPIFYFVWFLLEYLYSKFIFIFVECWSLFNYLFK